MNCYLGGHTDTGRNKELADITHFTTLKGGLDMTDYIRTLQDYELCQGCKKVMVKQVYREFDFIPLCTDCRNKPITKGGVKKCKE